MRRLIVTGFLSFLTVTISYVQPANGFEQVGQDAGISRSDFCRYSWDQKKGTTDYTLFDAYLGRNYHSPDRSNSQTLQENVTFLNMKLCQKVDFLRHCFEKNMSGQDRATSRFRAWAEEKGLDPVTIQMAIAQQETKLGALKDYCRNGSCNGIGIGQIITAIGPDGELLSVDDPAWDGITHNILTNLKFSVRVLEEKSSFSSSLQSLARNYNGHPDHKEQYSRNVVQFYDQIDSCNR